MIPLRDTVPSRSAPVVTWSLIAANTLVFLFELSLHPEELEALFYLFGIVPARYTHPEWALWVGFPVNDYWPFVTSMFLHGGWLHLVGNMWTLWIFGDNVEDRMGRWRFLAFYLVAGLAAGLTHWFTNADSVIPTVGASGAIAGVLGAYFVLFPHARIIAWVPVLFWPFFFGAAGHRVPPAVVPDAGFQRHTRRANRGGRRRNRVVGARGRLRRRRAALSAVPPASGPASPALRAGRGRHRGRLGKVALVKSPTEGCAWNPFFNSSGSSSSSRRCSP